jgi:hypothetical protein
MNRRWIVAALVAIGVLGFAGGALTMRLADAGGLFGKASAGAWAQAEQGVAWPFFGKPRSAGAARAAPPKPEGFAVWRQHIDTSQADPVACVQMTRPLDPTKSYADYGADLARPRPRAGGQRQ